MQWTKEADKAISRVPFFVRKRVRKRVEEEARGSGAKEVRMDHVRSSQQKFFRNMDSEIRGYRIETCFGPGALTRQLRITIWQSAWRSLSLRKISGNF